MQKDKCVEIDIVKLSGTGNEFVAIDNRDGVVDVTDADLWVKVCDLESGIGADGVLLVEKSQKYDFRMRYINCDGGEAEMCGNGARAITYFASKYCGITGSGSGYQFETMNGVYRSEILEDGRIRLLMSEISREGSVDFAGFDGFLGSFYLDTGVPHVVFHVESLDDVDVVEMGRLIRNDACFVGGVNVNFFEVVSEGRVSLRTYERGVERETGSCGTGAVATALGCARLLGWSGPVVVDVLGGELEVEFDEEWSEVYLVGGVEELFKSSLEL